MKTWRLLAPALLALSAGVCAAQAITEDGTAPPQADGAFTPSPPPAETAPPAEGTPAGEQSPDPSPPPEPGTAPDGDAAEPGNPDGAGEPSTPSEPGEEEPALPGEPGAIDGAQASPLGAGDEIDEVVVDVTDLYGDLAVPHGIQSDGAYRTSYPIAVPAYRGLEPSLSLDYASLGWSFDDVDNVAGSGWRIGGVSKIERRSSGGGVPPHDLSTGVLMLDGMRLIPCSAVSTPSASCSSGGDYAPEQEDYSRIEFYGSRGDRASKFRVWRPDGTRLTYETLAEVGNISIGTRPETLIARPSSSPSRSQIIENREAIGEWDNRRNILAANTWLLTEVRNTQFSDPSVVTYAYAVGPGPSYDHHVTSISYAGSEGYRISFAYARYESPPLSQYWIGPTRRVAYTYYYQFVIDNDQDEWRQATGYVDIAYPRGRQEYRLQTVAVRRASGSPIRAYKIEYGSRGSASDPHLLARIYEYGSDVTTSDGLVTGGSRLPPTQFAYTTDLHFSDSERRAGQGARMSGITTPMGGTLSIGYTRSDNTSVATDDQTGTVRSLVSSITEAAGRGPSATVAYRYSGGRRAPSGRPLGFRTLTATLPKLSGEASAPELTSTYDNASIATNGRPTRREYRVGGALRERVSYGYEPATTGNGPYRTRLTSVHRISFEGPDSTTRLTRYHQDDYGNVDRVQELGYVNGEDVDLDPSDSLTTLIDYAARITDEYYITDRPTIARKLPGVRTQDDAGARLWGRRFNYEGQDDGVLRAPGNLTKVQIWTGGGYDVLARYAYYPSGNLEHSYDARGAETDYAYDGPDYILLREVRNPLGHTAQTAWYNGCQVPEWTQDANGLKTRYAYDAFCRETSRTLPTGHTISTAYRNIGDPTEQYVRTSQPSGSSDSNRNTTTERTYLDGLGRPWRTARSGTEETESGLIVTLSGWDARGNLAWTSIPLAWGDAANGTGTPPDSKRTRFAYDDRDRLTRTTHANGAEERLAYETGTITVAGGAQPRHRVTVASSPECHDTATSPPCQRVRTIVGGRGWTVRQVVEDPQSQAVDTDATAHVTKWRHDALGRLVGIEDPRGSTWSYSYDGRGNRTVSDDPDLGRWTMAYDDAGNLTRQTDAKGQKTDYTYDLLGG